MKAIKQTIFGKIEATYGTDPLPVAATDSILVTNVKISPLEITASERNSLRGFLGDTESVMSGENVKFGFDIEMFASGVAGTAPAYGPVFKACANSETIVASTSVTYAGIDTAEPSMTFYYGKDGKRRVITGWRGDVKAKLVKGIPMWSFEGIGLYTLATDTAMAAPVLTAWKKPLAVEAGVTTVSLHGYTGLVSDFSFNQGSAVVYRNLMNGENVQFNGRKSTGSITIEEPLMAGKDFETIIRAATTGALAVTHGTAAGNRVKINAAQTQIISYAEAEQDGVAMLTLGLKFVSTAANNEYSIVYD